MRRPFSPSITRLSPRSRDTANDPRAIAGPRSRPRGSRRPHTDAMVLAVRRLIEETTLTYGEIALRTGVGRASICRWTRDQKWQRPLFAPRATDTVPHERASAHLRRRTLAERLSALAERAIREQEKRDNVDLEKLAEALELLKLAKLAAIGRHRPRQRRGAKFADHPPAGHPQIFDAGPREVMRGLRAAGVRVERAPEEALTDFIASRAPMPKRLTKRQRMERWMREK